MKREEAIYCLKAQSERYSEVCEECPLYGQIGVDHCCEDALQMAITALQNQPVWIPVSERPPEPYSESYPHKQTNADKIRSMTDKELAMELLYVLQNLSKSDKVCDFSHDCKDCTLIWLQKESEDKNESNY